MTDGPSDDAVSAAEAVVAVLRRIGLSDEAIVAGAVEAAGDAADSVGVVASECELLYGRDDPSARTGLLQHLLGNGPRGVVVDHAYDHRRSLAPALDRALSAFGHGFDLRPVGADEWVEPSHDHHPRAVRLAVTDGAGGTVSTAAFRYPPWDGWGHAATNARAFGHAANETVLAAVDLRLLLLASGDDAYRWVVLDRATLADLEAEYGPDLAVFGDPLVERGPTFAHGWDGVDRSVTVDHETAFGVPEPPDTYRLEDALDG